MQLTLLTGRPGSKVGYLPGCSPFPPGKRRADAPTRAIRYRSATRAGRLPTATGALLARLLEDARPLAEVSAILPVVAIRDEILEL